MTHNDTVPYDWTVVNKLLKKTTTPKKQPLLATMERWMQDGVAKATDGCRVEPDGTCIHGKPSWLIVLGFI